MQLRQLSRLELALCGLINCRSREALAIGVESALRGRLESFGRRCQRWCDIDDRAGVINRDASLRLVMAHRSHEERVGEPLVHELHVTLDEIVLRAPRGKYDAWLVKTRRKMRGTSPRSCCMRHVCCASESPSGEEAGVERYDVAAVPHRGAIFSRRDCIPLEN